MSARNQETVEFDGPLWQLPGRWRRFFAAGWNDYLSGRDFRADIDCLHDAEQLAYEQGRLYASNARLARLTVEQIDGGPGGMRSAHLAIVRSIGVAGDDVVPPDIAA